MVEWIREVEPRVEVKVMDLSVEPDAGGILVFAVPTYVYGDQALFLGNPSPQELKTWLGSLDLEV